MKLISTLLILPLILSLIVSEAYALAPVESLVLGDFSSEYSENKTDPLNYVFSIESNLKNSSMSFKKQLAVYRGFYEEAKNTVNSCRERHTSTYANDWEKVQVKRSTMAVVQYIGLDLITRALPEYAKKMEYTREEYVNMVEGLVGNYCSTNLSVISKRELLNNFTIKFDKENSYKLPNVIGNPFFPDNMDEYLPPKLALQQEFLYTVKLFQSLCSWNGNPNNPGLMVPILKNSAIMSFIARQMSNRSIGWNEISNSVYLNEDKNSVQVWCENLVCRKVSSDVFMRKFQYSIGGISVEEDIKRLYCDDFSLSDYKPQESDPRLAKIMNSISFDEENFINSQFIALITGVPDFLLRAEKFSAGEDIFRSSIDYTWTKWAKAATDKLNSDLLFEEPLSLEIVPYTQYTDRRSSKLKVVFDANLGEFDRINQRNGKLRVAFKISLANKFLDFYRRSQQEALTDTNKEKFRLMNRLQLQMASDISRAQEKLIIPPWKGNLSMIIAYELTSQIMETPERYLDFKKPGMQEIEVEINYGLFALKYINHQLEVKKRTENNPISTGTNK